MRSGVLVSRAMMKTALLAIAFVLTQFAQILEAGQTQTSASLQGLVIKLGTSQPVTRARVTLSEIDGESETAATTDGGGKFAFPNVQPGRYRLSATRDGYLRTEYGQQSPARLAGQPITLGEKATGQGFDLRQARPVIGFKCLRVQWGGPLR